MSIYINNTFEIHKQVKANDTMSQRFGDLMTSAFINEWINDSEFKRGKDL